MLVPFLSGHPDLARLASCKNDIAERYATPPFYLQADLRNLKLSTETFGTKFDVVLIDPPWEEYATR